ncbi:hypothetical protein G9A89_008896 [Geosiphon pyriformis]|nr:hypothetical protein G9A89_008896 [Geosiphon pyriformis]
MSYLQLYFFKIEELSEIPLFSRAAIEKKTITAICTDIKVNGQAIKLILDSGSAGSIITQQFINQLDHRVNCTTSARIITADEIPATCGHFKFITMPAVSLIEFDNEEKKPIWEAYQIFWADNNYNELSPILD